MKPCQGLTLAALLSPFLMGGMPDGCVQQALPVLADTMQCPVNPDDLVPLVDPTGEETATAARVARPDATPVAAESEPAATSTAETPPGG